MAVPGCGNQQMLQQLGGLRLFFEEARCILILLLEINLQLGLCSPTFDWNDGMTVPSLSNQIGYWAAIAPRQQMFQQMPQGVRSRDDSAEATLSHLWLVRFYQKFLSKVSTSAEAGRGNNSQGQGMCLGRKKF